MYWDTDVFSWVCKQLNCQLFRLLLMVLFVLQLSLQYCYNFILSIKAIDDKAAEISATLSLFLSAAQSRLTTAFVQEMTQKRYHVTIDSGIGRSGGCCQTTVRWSSWIWLIQDLACLHVLVSLRLDELPMFVLTRCQNWNWTLLRLAKRAFVKLLRSAHRQKSLKHL